MKPASVLKPLAFALAALMAVAAHATPPSSGALSAISDTQKSHDNSVKNEGTKNNTTTTNSVNGNSGNVGYNSASGTANQQDNSTAISTATADGLFVFGSTGASVDVNQANRDNSVKNYGTQYNATTTNSVNGNTGNVGANVAAGDFNQQKNNTTLAVGPGKVTIAAADISQVSTGNRFLNESAGSGYGASPVLNNSTVANSVNGNVGNVGFNSAAGAGNQQSNSLSIGSACGGCARF